MSDAMQAQKQQHPNAETAAPLLVRKPPAGAPNIVLVLLDDVGFGAASTFGGPVEMPTLDQLSLEGLRYNCFHTTAICSPTRASLLTGRNPHVAGVGAVMNVADDRPGYNGFIQKDTAMIAEILRQNGFSTAAFGKWHLVPDWEASQSGPFDRWPTGQGFEKFYGFIGGETDQFEPTLYNGTTPVLRPDVKDYILDDDLANQCIDWINLQRAVTPDKPFFIHLATGGIHAPVQAPKSWIERYRGRFDQGWDKLREEIFARQKQLNIIPQDTQLTPRPAGIPAWDSLTQDQKKIAARLMEAYAGYLAHTDAQVGRVAQALRDMGQFENTIFLYIVGDNGASAEGGLFGSINYTGQIQGVSEPESLKLQLLDEIGGPNAYAHINAGWAWGTDTPFQWVKTVASHLGGTRNPMVVTWPRRIRDKGGLRTQFSHVNDIVPTLLEAVGIPAPEVVNGVRQKPMDGVSLVYTFDAPDESERHVTQYFEVFGHRAIYHEGWMASAFHDRMPWTHDLTPPQPKPFENDKWELYNLRVDFSQAHDLAETHPQKLEEMKALFMREAERNQVLPLSAWRSGRPGLPDLSAGVLSVTYREGAEGVPEGALPRIFNRSWSIRAALDVTEQAQGVIAAVGGRSAGLSLHLAPDRTPVFTYRLFSLKLVELRGQRPLPLGENKLSVDFEYDGPGWCKGGSLTFYVNGEKAGTDTLPETPPAFFSINETFDLGLDRGSAVGNYPQDAAPGYPLVHARIKAVDIELR